MAEQGYVPLSTSPTHPLLGQTLALRTVQVRRPDGTYNEFLEIIDHEKEEEIKKTYPNVRFLVPGWLFSMMVQPGRTNIRVNRSGVITDVYEG